MSRLPFNVLVLPFRIRAGRFECAVFLRSDADWWQFIAGGGEGQEDPMAAARREALEEGGVTPEAKWTTLDTMASIPRSVFAGTHWPDDIYVIPQHAFAVDMADACLRLSSEHDRFEWLDYETALLRLTFDSNKTALWELHERLGRLSNTVISDPESALQPQTTHKMHRPSNSRSRSIANWSGMALAMVMAVLLMSRALSGQFEFDLAESHSVRIEDGSLKVFMWPLPRQEPQPWRHPDCFTFPMWFLLTFLTVPTGVLLWYGSRRRGSRNTEDQIQTNEGRHA